MQAKVIKSEHHFDVETFYILRITNKYAYAFSDERAWQCNETCWFGIRAEISPKNYVDELDRILDVNSANKIVRTYSFIIFIGFIVFHGFLHIFSTCWNCPANSWSDERFVRNQKKNMNKKWNKTPTTTSFITCSIFWLLLMLNAP